MTHSADTPPRSEPQAGGASLAPIDPPRLYDEMNRLAERLLELPHGAKAGRPHPLLVSLLRDGAMVVYVPARVWDDARSLVAPFAQRCAEGTALLVLVGRPRLRDYTRASGLGISTVLPEDACREELEIATDRAFELLEAKGHAESRAASLSRFRFETDELVDIARAMTTERDVDKLLGLILQKSRFVTGADAGSIYVVENEGETLRFKLSQNDSISFDSREFTMPLSNRSIAGAAAVEKRAIMIEDVYALPPSSTFAFDRRFDEKIGYRTKSMMTVPLISQRGEVLGVIQLINKKRDPRAKVVGDDAVALQVVPFDERSAELLGLVAAQAGISLETATLYQEIQALFEGFVGASVEAIESRDPTTSGHSRRVANLTVALAKAVDRTASGPYAAATFGREDLRELEYASLLHDFGKIGVRESVLVKAKKLFDERLELIRARFDFVARSIETDILSRKLQAVERQAPLSELRALDDELTRRIRALDESMQTILAANEPTVLAAGDFAKIEALAKEWYLDLRGETRLLLEPDEVTALSVKKGSLTPVEYDEITQHVTHTFRFLSRIPWGKALRRVPHIAGAHHERVNGTGYPNRLRSEEIPVQSKMMSVTDIFDALTASDRPYKKAVPLERAIDILEYSVKDGHVDGDLVRIFKEARCWEATRP
ncbi:MAG: GAF domain-containing protein [Myxococcales bacterium]|nr:GAF domain-containing protein [Myxococcales bacterium]